MKIFESLTQVDIFNLIVKCENRYWMGYHEVFIQRSIRGPLRMNRNNRREPQTCHLLSACKTITFGNTYSRLID